MSFVTIEFLVLFLPAVVLAVCLGSPKYKSCLLCLFSALFYAWCGLYYLLLLTVSAGIIFMLTGILFRSDSGSLKKTILWISLIYVLGILCIYKYIPDLLPAEIQSILFINTDPAAKVLLPLGLSFYSLSLLSYVLDIYYEKTVPEKSFLNMYLYISYFPKIIQGPVMKYSDFKVQMEEGLVIEAGKLDRGLELFIIGMFKKVMIADQIMPIASYSFEYPAEVGTGSAWISALAYCLVLYYDFSGYSDMASGLGLMTGFSLPVNFDHPYSARSVSEFWRKWHITLGEWFKDYVYIPCFRTVSEGKFFLKYNATVTDILSLLAVWLLIGIWHGSGWKYVFYGLWWFVFIAVERLLTGTLKKRKKEGRKRLSGSARSIRSIGCLNCIFSRISVFFAVVLGFVVLRAESLQAAFAYWKKLFSFTAGDSFFVLSRFTNQAVCAAIVGFVFIFPVYERIKTGIFERNNTMRIIYRAGLLAVAVITFFFAISGGKSSFLYEIY